MLGAAGTSAALLASVVVLVAWARGSIQVLGYTPLMLAVAFFGGSTALGLGIVGQYLWLALENARRRPNFVVREAESFEGGKSRGRGA